MPSRGQKYSLHFCHILMDLLVADRMEFGRRLASLKSLLLVRIAKVEITDEQFAHSGKEGFDESLNLQLVTGTIREDFSVRTDTC